MIVLAIGRNVKNARVSLQRKVSTISLKQWFSTVGHDTFEAEQPFHRGYLRPSVYQIFIL